MPRPERAGLVRVWIAVGHVRLAVLFDQHTSTSEELHQFGSGLRNGFANTGHLLAGAALNLSATHRFDFDFDFDPGPDPALHFSPWVPKGWHEIVSPPRLPMAMRPDDRGFTLIELVIAVALVGVLAAIAYPSYISYQNKARNAGAAAYVTTMGAVIERHWLEVQSYPASLAEVGLGGKLDPWGHPYVYYNIAVHGKGGARKDHALNPINTDFDLYSLGADGESKSQITQKSSLDDVIRANNGKFIGLAADF